MTSRHSVQSSNNGADASVLAREREKPVPSKAALEAEWGQSNGIGITESGSNGAGGATPASAAAARNGAGIRSATLRVPDNWGSLDASMPRVEGDVDPCESGEVLSCANLRLTAREKAAMDASTSDVRLAPSCCSPDAACHTPCPSAYGARARCCAQSGCHHVRMMPRQQARHGSHQHARRAAAAAQCSQMRAPARPPRPRPRARAAIVTAASASVQMEGADDAGDEGTPYAQAGFSSWRRTIQIYAFAAKFALRYRAIGRERTYKKMPVRFQHPMPWARNGVQSKRPAGNAGIEANSAIE
jgi:hypothetical protein